MERPLSSRADISREIRGWSGFTLKALALVAVIGLVAKVVENIDTFGQALSGFMNGGKKTEDGRVSPAYSFLPVGMTAKLPISSFLTNESNK